MNILTKRSSLNRSRGGDLFLNLFLLICGVVMVLPMVYAFSSSLKPLDEFFLFPPRFFVKNPTFRNFSELFRMFANSRVPFARYLFNTLLIAVAGTAGQVVICSLCAYAIAKLRFPGKRVLFKIIVTTLMFNTSVTGITNFLVIKSLGMMDSYWAIILPAFTSPLGLYLMKQFMDQMVSDTILEAARMDGSGELRTFFFIVMPAVRPAWLTLIVFAFQGLWNVGASPYIYEENLKTVNYALSQVLAGGVARSGAAAAGTVLTMLIPILIFIITQSNIVETMTASGIKE